jgi:hypothetical protein
LIPLTATRDNSFPLFPTDEKFQRICLEAMPHPLEHFIRWRGMLCMDHEPPPRGKRQTKIRVKEMLASLRRFG